MTPTYWIILLLHVTANAYQNIVIKNHKLVPFYTHKILKRHYNIPLEERKNIMQEGYLGIIRAAQKYNESYNTSFSYYSKFWIDRYVKVAIDNYYKKSISLEFNHDVAVSNTLQSYDTMDLWSALHKLPPQEKEFIINRYLKKYTYVKLGEEYNMHRNTAKSKVDHILHKLKIMLS